MARAAPWHRTRACKFERAHQTPGDKCEDPTSPRLLGNSELEAGSTGQDFRTLVGAHVKGVHRAQSSFLCTLASVPRGPAQKTSTESIDNQPQLTTSHEKAEDCEVALLWGCGATLSFFCRHCPLPSLQALVLWTLGALGRFGTLGCGTACRSFPGRPGRRSSRSVDGASAPANCAHRRTQGCDPKSPSLPVVNRPATTRHPT